MKKTIILTLLALLAFTGCEITEEQKQHEDQRKELPMSGDFKCFTFKGHDYIWFCSDSFDFTADFRIGGVVHDPDCRKCNGTLPTGTTQPEEELSEYEQIFGRRNQ